jgi:3-oxoacyl-[acyl-carrier-protein] synthase II
MKTDDLRQIIEQQLGLTRRLRARIGELEAERHSPLAVVGMAVRLPGAVNTPEDYWSLLVGDRDVVTAIPENRPGLRAVYDPRRNQPGTSYVDRASFLDDVAGFDAAFFGISAREAESLDPQQRMLLETCHEALERAGIPVDRQLRIPAGVFVGIMASEYGHRIAGRADKTGVDPYYGTGGGHCFAAGRVSYAMGFSGPAVSVDTACSSSLVALHLAAQSLRAGECRYALVGGANMLFSGDLMVSLAQSGALSPDGRSKTFRADADGYGRGEGVAVMAVMRLADAEREGRPILAVVRGSAVNHDGASSGLTVPNGPAQQELLRNALADARVPAHEVGWIEAHGTGTSLGDPIEIGALSVLAGPEVPERTTPLGIGSVKSRIGHLEAAAGIAGLIKVVMMLQHGVLPPAIEPDAELNPLAPWSRLSLDVPREAQPWPEAYTERIAGVSAFGLSGTNAHALLSAYQPADEAGEASDAGQAPAEAAAGGHLLVLSAKGEAPLRQLAATVADLLAAAGDRPAPWLADLCHTLRAGRAAHDWRLAVSGAGPAELRTALTGWLEQNPTGRPERLTGKLVLRVLGSPAELAAGLTGLGRAFGALTLPNGAPDVALAELLRQLGVNAEPVAAKAAGPGGPVAELESGGRRWPLLTRDPADAPALLLAALAGLYTHGARLRLDALSGPGARLLPSAPTYPFAHKHYWIDEPEDDEVGSAKAGSAAQHPDAVDPGDADLRDLDREAAQLESAETLPVQTFLLDELALVLRSEEPIDPESSFLDIGGDSFTALLLLRSFEEQYGVALPAEEFELDVPLRELALRLEQRVRPDSANSEMAGYTA